MGGPENHTQYGLNEYQLNLMIEREKKPLQRNYNGV